MICNTRKSSILPTTKLKTVHMRVVISTCKFAPVTVFESDHRLVDTHSQWRREICHRLMLNFKLKISKFAQTCSSFWWCLMIAENWSVANKAALKMPLRSFVAFKLNPHFLSTRWPPRSMWRVVKGRYKSYVRRVHEKLDE